MRTTTLALAGTIVLAGCAQTRLAAGRALIVSEASVEASANTAAANAALMSPEQRAKVKAAIDSADAAVVAAHAAYNASKPK